MPADIESTGPVTLREISEDTLKSILDLDVTEQQKQFVAPNVRSIAQAHFSERAWFRAIYAGETPVGFVMLYLDTETPEYYLWRLMVDHRYQGKGYGAAAMRQVIDFVRQQPNARELGTSYVPGDGSPAPFYRKLGFEETGKWYEGERVMVLLLEPCESDQD